MTVEPGLSGSDSMVSLVGKIPEMPQAAFTPHETLKAKTTLGSYYKAAKLNKSLDLSGEILDVQKGVHII